MSSEEASGGNFPAICLQISPCAAGAQQRTKLFAFQSTIRESQPKMFPLGRTTSRALASRTITAATVTSHLVHCPRSITSTPYVVPGASLPERRTYLNARYSGAWRTRYYALRVSNNFAPVGTFIHYPIGSLLSLTNSLGFVATKLLPILPPSQFPYIDLQEFTFNVGSQVFFL
jgi:hypothetical protein